MLYHLAIRGRNFLNFLLYIVTINNAAIQNYIDLAYQTIHKIFRLVFLLLLLCFNLHDFYTKKVLFWKINM